MIKRRAANQDSKKLQEELEVVEEANTKLFDEVVKHLNNYESLQARESSQMSHFLESVVK